MQIFLLFALFSFFSKSLACESDSDCSILNYCLEGSCIHKSLFPDLSFLEIISLFLFFSGSILTTVAGVGGGVFFYPFLILLMGFTTQESAPLSITMVFFILLIRNLLSLSDRNIYRDRPIINYDIVLVFSPSIIIGTIFGVLINAVSSTWFILIFLIMVMTVNSILTLQKAIELRSKALVQKKIDMDLTKDAEKYLNELKEKIAELDKSYLKDKLDDENDELQKSSLLDDASSEIPLKNPEIRWNLPQLKRVARELEVILAEENRFMDYEKVFWLFLNASVIILLKILRGTNDIASIIDVQKCSVVYWLLTFLYIPFGLLFMFLVVKFLVKENKWKLESGYVFHKNDLHYDLHTCLLIFATGVGVGMISTILGFGGAILASPMLMRFGIETQEASFTASFCAFFSSLASVAQYFIAGDIKNGTMQEHMAW